MYKTNCTIPIDENFSLEVSGDDFSRKTFKVNSFTYRLKRFSTDNLANWQCREAAIRYTSEKAICKSEKAVKSNVKALRLAIEKGKLHPAYGSMKIHADRVVKHYMDDFIFHDALLLSELECNFVWIVRECGTHLLTDKSQVEFINHYSNPNNASGAIEFYLWNGGTLQKVVNPGELLSRLTSV